MLTEIIFEKKIALSYFCLFGKLFAILKSFAWFYTAVEHQMKSLKI